MERMLVVVFDSDAKAHEGSRALERLADEGRIAVYADGVVAKDAGGMTTVIKGDDAGPLGALGGTTVGSLLGMLGGPVGVLIGAAGGLALGATTDFARARVGDDFVTDVSNALAPGKTAVVAEIDEESTGPVDARMAELGGIVFRRALSDVEDSAYEHEIAAIKADIAQTKAEHAASRAERKARLQARIDSLNDTLRQKIDHTKARRDAVQREAVAKVAHLKTRAVDASQDIKTKQADRISALRKRYDKWLGQLTGHSN